MYRIIHLTLVRSPRPSGLRYVSAERSICAQSRILLAVSRSVAAFTPERGAQPQVGWPARPRPRSSGPTGNGIRSPIGCSLPGQAPRTQILVRKARLLVGTRQVHTVLRVGARSLSTLLATAAPHSSPWRTEGYVHNFREAA